MKKALIVGYGSIGTRHAKNLLSIGNMKILILTKRKNLEINQKNIFEEKNLQTDTIISRAFKPLPVIFEIALKNFKKFKYIILFLGKSGKEILKEASKKWKFDYEEKKSLTSNESLVIKISNLQKK